MRAVQFSSLKQRVAISVTGNRGLRCGMRLWSESLCCQGDPLSPEPLRDLPTFGRQTRKISSEKTRGKKTGMTSGHMISQRPRPPDQLPAGKDIVHINVHCLPQGLGLSPTDPLGQGDRDVSQCITRNFHLFIHFVTCKPHREIKHHTSILTHHFESIHN